MLVERPGVEILRVSFPDSMALEELLACPSKELDLTRANLLAEMICSETLASRSLGLIAVVSWTETNQSENSAILWDVRLTIWLLAGFHQRFNGSPSCLIVPNFKSCKKALNVFFVNFRPESGLLVL